MPPSKNSLLVLGLMSGTSADGIDIALTKISGAPPNLNAKLLNHTSVDFPPQVRKEILRIAEQTPIPAGDLSQLNFRLGDIYAEAALTACKRFRISPKKISILGNHGQTIFHQGPPIPYLGRPTASTLQIGEASIIAARTGITTISDFRPADIALGGQGAPLVPYADYLLYRHPKLGRVSLNLGGIANITVLPAGCKPSQVFAFDTGPANILIDALVQHFTHGRQRFDKDAKLAQSGRTAPALVDELMRDPISTQEAAQKHRPRILRTHLRQESPSCGASSSRPSDRPRPCSNRLHRLVRHRRPQPLRPTQTQNRPTHRLRRRRQKSAHHGATRSRTFCAPIAYIDKSRTAIQILPSDDLGVPTAAKEAFAFALMAYETFHQRPSNLPFRDWRRGPAILGKISYAPPR